MASAAVNAQDAINREWAALDKALEIAMRSRRNLKKLLGRGLAVTTVPGYVVYDNNRTRVEVNRKEVDRLLASYARFAILLDVAANRCYSRYAGKWVRLKCWQTNLLKSLIVNAGKVVPSMELVPESGVDSTGPLPLLRKRMHLLRKPLRLPGRGKDREVIMADSGLDTGYIFNLGEPYCLIDRTVEQPGTIGNNQESGISIHARPGASMK